MYVSKRSLGEGYIVATGAVLGVVLVAQMGIAGPAGLFWVLASGVSVSVLVGAAYWLQRLDLSSDQVWLVSNCSALGLGIGTTGLVIAEIATPTATVVTVDVAVLGATLGAAAVLGSLGGVVVILHRSNRDLQRQNAVLHRILRHNLRNDMSVVLCLLDDIEASTDGEPSQTARQAQKKVQSFVRLTDRVRQANVGLTDPAETQECKDITTLVESRVDQLRQENPELTIRLDLPEHAVASVSGTFGLVVDNLVESALSDRTTAPQLRLCVETDRDTVRLLVEDTNQTIPAADLTAVAAGSETALEHGFGVELWLVEWLVEANDGEVTFDMSENKHQVTIELDRVRSGWRG
ncbi:sensor histidine kinase [Salinibaculum salinum]|uniref:sensor histidine kinase n=1 Tax=Salinibaculum salinum TaxID=3131996 RepID=UPI0030ED04EB